MKKIEVEPTLKRYVKFCLQAKSNKENINKWEDITYLPLKEYIYVTLKSTTKRYKRYLSNTTEIENIKPHRVILWDAPFYLFYENEQIFVIFDTKYMRYKYIIYSISQKAFIKRIDVSEYEEIRKKHDPIYKEAFLLWRDNGINEWKVKK